MEIKRLTIIKRVLQIQIIKNPRHQRVKAWEQTRRGQIDEYGKNNFPKALLWGSSDFGTVKK
jgi:hypothetical protein